MFGENDEVTSRIDIFTKAKEYPAVSLRADDLVDQEGNVISKEECSSNLYMDTAIAHTSNQSIF